MSQLKRVAEPFGEVNVFPTEGVIRVVATLRCSPYKEGAQTGIALDGSGSMNKVYGTGGDARVLSSIFAGKSTSTNQITPIAQKICAYLARQIDADGGTTCIYWSVGPGGGSIEFIGDLTAEQAERHSFGPPQDFGTGTQLLPAVRYFTERFADAPYGFYVILTDGELHDLDEVLNYSKRLAREVEQGRRNPLKFVLIGLGPDVNEYQMEELDDLESGTEVDLWDHKLARDMRQLEDIFAEVIDRNARVAPTGRLLGADGRVLRDFSRQGVPAYLEFEVPEGSPYFVLELGSQRIQQPLSDASDVAAVTSTPVAPTVAPSPVAPPTAAPVAPPIAAPVAPPKSSADSPESSEEEALWRDLPLEFAKDDSQEKLD